MSSRHSMWECKRSCNCLKGDHGNRKALCCGFTTEYVVTQKRDSQLFHKVDNWRTSFACTSFSSAPPQISGFYPNSRVLVAVFCTLPVISCRSFSGLKHVKTGLRSNMGNECLSRLALLHMHQGIAVNVEEIIIDEFSQYHPQQGRTFCFLVARKPPLAVRFSIILV